ncbi:substrate-binding and VWA domain-containing protein [Prescottella sp. R16]|uniref:substrate-binding and VWA domain-containing protein n=1 Tax=Prescottella sp. R16 TaxID=3064529 RepID=UPI00272E99C9|nr:substrate-binding and VWA domain-containing protein [Prescottella sp. R16]
MGRHRSDRRIRGISKGPVVAVGVVIALVLGVLGWFHLRDRTDDQGTAAAGTCVEGDATLTVAADPDIADAVRNIADTYTATRPVVRDHCITVTVHDTPTPAAVDALTTGTWNDTLGPAPALWIPADSTATARVPAVLDGGPKPIASTPVVLAARTDLPGLSWQDLPARQATDLKLALPDDVSASYAVLDAVAAATTNTPGPLDDTQAASPQVTAAISALTLAAPAAGPDPLTALAAGSAPFQTVPATAAALRDHPGLVAVTPTGPTPVADHPAAILDTDWVDDTTARAAAQFVDHLRKPEQQQLLTDAGFGTTPATTLTPATGPAATRLAQTFANPALPQTTTILLDVSGSMGYDDITGTRLNNTVTALTTRLDTLPDSSEVGLWVYSRGLDGAKPYQVKVPTGPLSADDRRTRLDDALRGLRPRTATSTYASLIAAHQAAAEGFTDGRTNSVLLITDGPNDDTSTTAAQLEKALTDAAHPVRVDVISIGDTPDRATLQKTADITGGTLTVVPSAHSPELTAALTDLLA